MSNKSAITWTETTWSPVIGCTPISPGCKNCYAKREVEIRWSKNPKSIWYGRSFGDVLCQHDTIFGAKSPYSWKRPRRIFVCPRADLFHDDVPVDFIRNVFMVMEANPQHTFQILTKRAKRMHFLLWSQWGWLPAPNVWIGVSIEDQATAEERIPLLLKTPAAVRWVSAEPLLGPVDLLPYLDWTIDGADMSRPDIDWVVCGGESGPNARPMHPAWARSMRDQCAVADVPFLFKQWGEWAEDRQHGLATGVDRPIVARQLDERTIVERIGVRHSGRLLDGVLHDAYPEVHS